MLLDRLGVAPELVKRTQVQTIDNHLQSNLAWIDALDRALSADDSAAIYDALGLVKPYRDRPAIRDRRVFQQLLKAAAEPYPTHIRARALELIGEVSDPNFCCYVEPFLDDPDDHIVAKAVEALRNLGPSASSDRIVSLLSKANTKRVKTACLRYLSAIELLSDTEKVTLLSACRTLSNEAPEDTGLGLLMLKAIANQADLFFEDAPSVLR
jgi:HEAT repeat protein